MVKNSSKNSKRSFENTEEINPKKQKIINEDNIKKKGKRVINLCCPSISKTAEIMAWEDQRLDLGTIARVFGLEPGTIKLNGHFISRGVDLIASCVTWTSLLSFFSSKGLSTGFHSSAPLIVDGKLYKSGSKRSHEPSEADRGVDCTKRYEEGVGVCRYSHHQEINSPSTKKLKENDNVLGRYSQTARGCDTGLKRRHWVEDTSPLKKVRVNGSYLDPLAALGRGVNERSCISELRCGHQITDSMKRLREDEIITGAACKKTRY